VDAEGHLRLTDFGLSKMNFGPDDLAETFCGSPEYMCPEMLKRTGHGHALDFYQLGALLYELLTGLPPHYNQNRVKMYQDIMNKTNLEFPRHLSRESIDLMKKMLDKNPLTRLCHPDDIRAHPFC
jgi:serum/glucocorticoid-regulated kinase 2